MSRHRGPTQVVAVEVGILTVDVIAITEIIMGTIVMDTALTMDIGMVGTVIMGIGIMIRMTIGMVVITGIAIVEEVGIIVE